MNLPNETVLSTLPGSKETERVQLVLCNKPNEIACIELRQQSFAPGLGWFNQSTVTLEPSQVAALRLSLGSGSSKESTGSLPSAFRRVTSPTWQPRVVRADSA
jgi:hypothetical protein